MPAIRQPTNPKGLCVFDIDATLTSHSKADPKVCGVPQMPSGPACKGCVGSQPAFKSQLTGTRDSFVAAYGREAIHQCLSNGYAVGLATARSCGGGTLNSRLKWLHGTMGYPNDAMTAAGAPGPSVGCAPHPNPNNKLKKSGSINRLMDHFNVTAKRTIFFDDSKDSLLAAKAAIPGLKTQLASSNCGGTWCPSACGLTKNEFNNGFNKVSHHHHHKQR